MRYNIYAVGDALRNIREKHGYTQSDMAESLDISCIHYSQIEQGRHRMSLDLMMKITSMYDVDPNTLFGVTVDQPANTEVDRLNQELKNLKPDEQRYVTATFLTFLEGFQVRKEAV